VIDLIMFAVPGWSVEQSKPKQQTLRAAAITEENIAKAADHTKASVDEQKTKTKHKKHHKGPQTGDVTAENVSELWNSIVLPSTLVTAKSNGSSKRKLGEDGSQTATANNGGADLISASQTEPRSQKKARRSLKTNKFKKAKAEEAASEIDSKSKSAEALKPAVTSKPAKVPKSDKVSKPGNESKQNQTPKPKDIPDKTPKAASTIQPTVALTPHQEHLRSKLQASRFRHLNESFYTSPSADIHNQIKAQPSLFEDYHVGFRQAAAAWPQNPLDDFIELIKTRGKVRSQKHSKGVSSDTIPPIPRSRDGVCVIADIGCGDARLARTLKTHSKRLNLDISSFDFSASADGVVQAADAANIPMADGSVSVAIFCLSLMGTNWPGFIDEAYRILARGGELWIAEIKSRFMDPATLAAANNKNKPKPSVSQRKIAKRLEKEAENELEVSSNTVDYEGSELVDRTPLEPFLEVLRRRGFQVKRETIDRENKMFVSMVFFKRDLEKEKEKEERDRAFRTGVGQQIDRRKWIEQEKLGSQEMVQKDAKVLKACSYKLR
jgi:ribosomal RNA-processing protein 8